MVNSSKGKFVQSYKLFMGQYFSSSWSKLQGECHTSMYFYFYGGTVEGSRVIWQFCTHATGSGKQLSKFSLILCNLCTPRSIYWLTSRPTRNQYLNQDMSIDRYIGRMLVGISADLSDECRSVCRPRVVVRLLVDISIDRLPKLRRYFTDTRVLGGLCIADVI